MGAQVGSPFFFLFDFCMIIIDMEALADTTRIISLECVRPLYTCTNLTHAVNKLIDFVF